MSSMSSRVGRQAENIRSEAQDTLVAATEAARDIGSDVARRAGAMAETAIAEGRKMGEQAGEIGSELFESASEAGAGLLRTIERSVERQPLTAVLIAAAAGLLLGGMLRR